MNATKTLKILSHKCDVLNSAKSTIQSRFNEFKRATFQCSTNTLMHIASMKNLHFKSRTTCSQRHSLVLSFVVSRHYDSWTIAQKEKSSWKCLFWNNSHTHSKLVVHRHVEVRHRWICSHLASLLNYREIIPNRVSPPARRVKRVIGECDRWYHSGDNQIYIINESHNLSFYDSSLDSFPRSLAAALRR